MKNLLNLNHFSMFKRITGYKIFVVIAAVIVYSLIAIFLVYPLVRLFYDAFTSEEGYFTLSNFVTYFSSRWYVTSLINSLLVSFATVILASILGISIAYLFVRFEFRGRSLFSILTFISIIMPPLVGVLGYVAILGRAGSINSFLIEYLGVEKPINFIYGLRGVLFVEAFRLFPLITFSMIDALGKIDSYMEEAAESVGAKGMRKFFTITLPLTTPGYLSGCLLVFVWVFADFVTPMILGVHKLIAPQAYTNIMQFIDRELFRMGIVMAAIMVSFAVIFVLVIKRQITIKDYATLSYSAVERKKLPKKKEYICIFYLALIFIISYLPYLGIILSTFGKGWAMTPLPVKYTLFYLSRVSVYAPMYIINSIKYTSISIFICIAIGVLIAWLLARTNILGKNIIDSLVTLVLAIPGTAIGIAYIRAFHHPMPFFPEGLVNVWIIMPIVLALRRMPYSVRGAYSSLLLVHSSLEEASESVGAGKLRTFVNITFPQIWKGVLVGAMFSFMTSLQEVGATLFIFNPNWETIPIGIFIYYTAGAASEASALGFILLIFSCFSLLIINKIAGVKAKGVFG